MTDPATTRSEPTHYRPGTNPAVRLKKRSLARRLLWPVASLAVLGALAGGVVLWRMDRTPREWAAELRRPATSGLPVLGAAARATARYLTHADRLAVAGPVALPASLGASADRSGAVPVGPLRTVASLQALAAAVADARPGDVIQIQPGQYRLSDGPIRITQPGTAAAPIVLRAARLGDVVIESDTVQAFKVSAPYWRFENLSLRGVCADHSQCEHAFHVVGAGGFTTIRNNLMTDFNAHIKINAENGVFPDGGLVEGNTMTESAPRVTANPVTPVDLVAASDWVIRGNVITDFIRQDHTSGSTYGAFVKGEGEDNVLERNAVICEWKIRTVPGQRVGLSLGGGGTGMALRRLKGRTGFEQLGGVIRDNLIAFCSDDGIYVNRAGRSTVDHNTLIDTAGIDVRFVQSSATVTDNIVDGAIKKRDRASLRSWDNDIPFLLDLFAGLHPQRAYYRDLAVLDLAWRTRPDSVPDPEPRVDLCGNPRGDKALPGAFEDYAGCLRGQ